MDFFGGLLSQQIKIRVQIGVYLPKINDIFSKSFSCKQPANSTQSNCMSPSHPASKPSHSVCRSPNGYFEKTRMPGEGRESLSLKVEKRVLNSEIFGVLLLKAFLFPHGCLHSCSALFFERKVSWLASGLALSFQVPCLFKEYLGSLFLSIM